MRFSAAVILGFVASALAQVKFLNSAFDVQEGIPINLQWGGNQGPVTITVMTGPEDNLREVTTIGTSLTGTSFRYVPSGLPSGTYAFRITDSTGVPNYSVQFQYEGSGAPLSSSASSASTASSASSTAESSSTAASSSSTAESTSSASTTASVSSTVTSASSTSASRTSSSATSTPSSSIVNNTNDNGVGRLASPLSLVLAAAAAFVFFN